MDTVLYNGIYDSTTEEPTSWNIARLVSTPRDIVFDRLPFEVPGDEGVSLAIVTETTATADDRTYTAVLTIDRALPLLPAVRVPVHLQVERRSPTTVVVSLRPIGRIPRLTVVTRRYFEAALSIVEELAGSAELDERAA